MAELVFKLKLDQKQQVFWTGYFMHENQIIVQINSDVFDPNNLIHYCDAFERCTVRMMKELAKEKDQVIIQHMLMQENN